MRSRPACRAFACSRPSAAPRSPACSRTRAATACSRWRGGPYASGDYFFNDPQHHGTPDQRLAAAYVGVNLANYALTQQRPPTWNEMHAIFMQGMPQILGSPSLADRNAVSPSNIASDMTAGASAVIALPLAEIAAGRFSGADVVMPSEQSLPRRWSAPSFD